MTETCCHFINDDINSETSKDEIHLKQTSMDSINSSITFDNYCDERIRIMKNSADEYAKFLTQLDNLIAKIDLTMETTRLPFKRKIVCFAEHNEIVRGRSTSSDVSSDISPSPLYIPPHRR